MGQSDGEKRNINRVTTAVEGSTTVLNDRLVSFKGIPIVYIKVRILAWCLL